MNKSLIILLITFGFLACNINSNAINYIDLSVANVADIAPTTAITDQVGSVTLHCDASNSEVITGERILKAF